ncbi:hypothetical protein QTP86_017564, partial [Hemibagrus guttatus]
MNKAIVVFLKSESLVNQLSVDGIWSKMKDKVLFSAYKTLEKKTWDSLQVAELNLAMVNVLLSFSSPTIMEFLVTLLLISLLFSGAITLHVRCFTGDSRGMNINVQTCSTPDLCVNGSLNTGIINVINTAECCSTNFCNNKTLPALSLMCHNCISEQCSEINCPDQCASVTLFIVSNGKNMTSVIKTCAIPQMCSSGSINLGELLMTSNVMCCNSTLCNKETLPALSLTCYQCLPSVTAICTNTETTCSDQCLTSTITTYMSDTKLQDVNMKTCGIADMCLFPSRLPMGEYVTPVMLMAAQQKWTVKEVKIAASPLQLKYSMKSAGYINYKTTMVMRPDSRLNLDCFTFTSSTTPTMKTQVTLLLTCMLFSRVGSTSPQDVILKLCATKPLCEPWSMNLGQFKMISNAKCCSSDLCNMETLPALHKQVPNGKTCYTCDGDNCLSKMSCEGNEDRCITTSGTHDLRISQNVFSGITSTSTKKTTMTTQISLLLICMLFSKALSLKCHQCVSAFSECNNEEKTCPDQCLTSTTSVYAGVGKMTDISIKTCGTPAECISGSMNLGVTKVVHSSKCCKTDFCNSETLPALSKQVSNGKKCYTCGSDGCSEIMNCEGNEDRCVSASWKGRELADMMERRKEEFVRNVLEVKRVSDRVMSLKLEIEGVMLNVVSGYAPQVGCDEEVMGKFGVKERNFEGQMVVDFAKRMDMGVVNTYFQKREEHRVTYKSGARQHRMVVCRMTLMVCKTKRQKLRQALGGQVVLPDDWETTAEVIRETGRKVLGVSSGRRKEDKETWWWNEEVQDSIQRKRLAKKKWDMDRTEENRQEYKELQRRVKREVSKAKQKAYDELYTRLDTREGEKDLYRLARQRDRDGKDVQQVRVIKDRDGRVLTSEESVQRRWKEYFEELMNEENEREKRVEGVNSVEQKVDKIRKDEVRKALKRMKSGKAVGPDDIPVEVWKCLGEAAVEFLASLFNRVLESERMPEEWRRSVLVPIFKNKGDVQSCSNYRGIKLMSHTMKLWERVVEARLRKVVEICEQQYGFMPRKSTTDAIFALRILMEKYRDGQRELHCVFVDLEKAYDRVPREELWYCMRKSGVAGKYVRVVQDMYERSRTVVRCAVGQTEEFNVEVGLHQGSALSPFLFAIVMDQLSEEVRQESPWTMMFADDIVICSESREQVEENLERWRFALERRGMKVSRSKTEYMCVNEREGSGTVRLQGEEVKKVEEFKYLGSTVQSNGECGKE